MDERDIVIQAYKENTERTSRFFTDYAEKTDRINKRLTRLVAVGSIIVAVMTVSFCVVVERVVNIYCETQENIANTYFTADYYYPNITTENSDNTTNTITNGGE